MHYFSYNTLDEQVDALCLRLEAELTAYLIKQDKVVLAVSGGRSPIPFFHKLSQADIDWQRVVVSLVDERFISPDQPDSNAYLIKTHLLINQASCATFVPLVTAVDDAALNLTLAQKNFQYPDIAILGMGEDGHTASLFPNAVELPLGLALSTTCSLITLVPPEAPYRRLSMTRSALLNSKQLYLSIQGMNKRAVFERACQYEDPRYPISYFIHQTKVPLDVYWAP